MATYIKDNVSFDCFSFTERREQHPLQLTAHNLASDTHQLYAGHAHGPKAGTVLSVPPTISMTHTQMPPGMASMGQRTPNLSYRATHTHTHAPIQQPIPQHYQHLGSSRSSGLESTNCNIQISVAGAAGAACTEELKTPKVTLLDDLSDEVNSSTDDCADCCLVDDSDTYEASNNNGSCANQEVEQESATAEDSGDSLGGIYIGPTH